MLPRPQIVALRQLASTIRLHRDELLAGIAPPLCRKLPRAQSPEAQLLYDLTHLNQLSKRDPAPLVQWLSNAAALSQEPAFYEALARLGVDVARAEEEALDVTDQATIHPRLSELQQQAQRLVVDGHPAAARAALRRADRAVALRLAHAPDDDYTRLVEGFVRKDHIVLFNRLGGAPAERTRMFAEAYALFHRLHDTHAPRTEERPSTFIAGHALLGAGNLALLEGKFSEAVNLIERARRLYPDSPSIDNDLAIARRAVRGR